MSEPQVLKAGDSLDFRVDGATLTIAPVPYGNIKKIMRIAFDAQKEIVGGQITGIPELVDKNLFKLFPLLFAPGKATMLTEDWIETHMTVPMLREMMEAAVVVNGLKDFFEQATGKPLKPEGSPPIPAIPLAKDGSTISAGSPTAGGLKT